MLNMYNLVWQMTIRGINRQSYVIATAAHIGLLWQRVRSIRACLLSLYFFGQKKRDGGKERQQAQKQARKKGCRLSWELLSLLPCSHGCWKDLSVWGGAATLDQRAAASERWAQSWAKLSRPTFLCVAVECYLGEKEFRGYVSRCS